MGKKQNQPFQFWFNASLKVDFQGSRLTSGGGRKLKAHGPTNRTLARRLSF
jgi:hypothetical protein